MRSLTAMTMFLCGLTNTIANAQLAVQIKNPYDDRTVVMRYVHESKTSRYWDDWSKAEIPPGKTVPIELGNARGKYRVAVFLKNGGSSPAEVSNKLVDLRGLANRTVVYELDATFHEDRRGRKVQVMSATLIDPQRGNANELTVAGNDAESEFVDQVLRANWRTRFEAVQGSEVSGILDLNRDADDGGPIFVADRGMNRRLSEVLAFDDAAKCHIIGRWVRDDGNLMGTFHFLVTKNSPNELGGTYKVDRQNREYRWTGQRIVESDE